MSIRNRLYRNPAIVPVVGVVVISTFAIFASSCNSGSSHANNTSSTSNVRHFDSPALNDANEMVAAALKISDPGQRASASGQAALRMTAACGEVLADAKASAGDKRFCQDFSGVKKP